MQSALPMETDAEIAKDGDSGRCLRLFATCLLLRLKGVREGAQLQLLRRRLPAGVKAAREDDGKPARLFFIPPLRLFFFLFEQLG